MGGNVRNMVTAKMSGPKFGQGNGVLHSFNRPMMPSFWSPLSVAMHPVALSHTPLHTFTDGMFMRHSIMITDAFAYPKMWELSPGHR